MEQKAKVNYDVDGYKLSVIQGKKKAIEGNEMACFNSCEVVAR